jgi:hypothetical protein
MVAVDVIANKIDLPVQIPTDKLQDWAATHRFQCFRTCAKKDETIEPIFKKIAEDLGAKQKPIEIAAGGAGRTKMLLERSEIIA